MSTRSLATPAGETAEDRARTVLAERARLLARPARAEPTEGLVGLVLFRIGGVKHAVEARFVREVLRRPPVSRVPLAPAALLGVANLRGEILAVADISVLLGVTAPEVPGPVVVLEGPGPPLGVAVDHVDDFVQVPAGSITTLPHHDPSTGSSSESLLLGVTPEAAVLSATAVLSDPRLSTTTETRSGR